MGHRFLTELILTFNKLCHVNFSARLHASIYGIWYNRFVQGLVDWVLRRFLATSRCFRSVRKRCRLDKLVVDNSIATIFPRPVLVRDILQLYSIVACGPKRDHPPSNAFAYRRVESSPNSAYLPLNKFMGQRACKAAMIVRLLWGI